MTIITAVFVPWTVWIFIILVHSSEGKCSSYSMSKDKKAVSQLHAPKELIIIHHKNVLCLNLIEKHC